ncbi:FAD-dependent oxidoreductase [Paenibacillus campinasensis]|uniref:FAD-dependent oxidoreductase n=1 Tax=Paenibacillus campinasensis TaxID=66347 RepID=A0A268EVZ0_9BACL|nr:FAD-dependent oxidoreductase [Paenibacillus campinasensis]PAD77299.1 FAD-dependent oxidoreductase [Paenibacillus campinasensis]
MNESGNLKQGLPQYPESLWRATSELPSFDRLAEDIQADVAVVGGGITGITTAYLLAKEGMDVVVLEAGKILNGATGFTTAKVTAQHGLIYHEFEKHFGAENARKYYEGNREAIEFIRDMVGEEEQECGLKLEDAYIYTEDERSLSKLEDELKTYEKLSIPGEWMDKLPLPIPIQGAIKMPGQYQFHPLQYMKRLTERFLKLGGRIYEYTTIDEQAETSGPVILQTTRGNHKITCNFAVSASHFPFYDGKGMYFARLHVERSYAIAVKPETAYPGGMYLSIDQPVRSLRSASYQGEDLVIVGGENHKTGKGISTYKHYENLELFAGKLLGTKEIPYRWSTQDLVTLDNLPYIGSLTPNEDKIFVATGFRKWGMTTSALAAHILADKVLQRKNRYAQLFSPSRFKVDPSLKTLVVQNAGVVKDFIAGKVDLKHTDPSKLGPGEAAIVRHNGQRAGAFKDEAGNLHMVDTTCTHMGCEVEWNEGERSWDCPCHGSRYTFDGEVLEGPAIEPLKKLNPDD